MGAIRPALKVVHLKPGQTAEDFKRPTLGEGFPSSEEASQRRRETATLARPEGPGRSIVTGILLVFGALIALSYLLLFQNGEKGLGFSSEPETHESNFSHIVIHEKKEILVDGAINFGVYRVDEKETALGKPRAILNRAKNTLEIHYPSTEKSQAGNLNPVLKVWLQFSKLENKIERDKLQSYMIELSGEKEPQRIVRTYSRHLAEFAEVSLLSSGIKAGDNIRGSMQSAQTIESGPLNAEVSWQLTFDIPIEIAK